MEQECIMCLVLHGSVGQPRTDVADDGEQSLTFSSGATGA